MKTAVILLFNMILLIAKEFMIKSQRK